MKKFFVLGTLFILPIVVYLFFASGVNNFAKLDVLVKGVNELPDAQSLSKDNIKLTNKITVLGFLGNNLSVKKANAFNLNQKIYKRFNGFTDFQFVMVLPEGTQPQAAALLKELNPLADVQNWNFVFIEPGQLSMLFKSLNTPYTLDENYSTNRVFIIDKDKNLRGRKKDEDGEILFGYDATSVAELNNKMVDDVKVILAEYRLAIKKNYKGSKRDSVLKKVN